MDTQEFPVGLVSPALADTLELADILESLDLVAIQVSLVGLDTRASVVILE